MNDPGRTFPATKIPGCSLPPYVAPLCAPFLVPVRVHARRPGCGVYGAMPQRSPPPHLPRIPTRAPNLCLSCHIHAERHGVFQPFFTGLLLENRSGILILVFLTWTSLRHFCNVPDKTVQKKDTDTPHTRRHAPDPARVCPTAGPTPTPVAGKTAPKPPLPHLHTAPAPPTHALYRAENWAHRRHTRCDAGQNRRTERGSVHTSSPASDAYLALSHTSRLRAWRRTARTIVYCSYRERRSRLLYCRYR